MGPDQWVVGDYADRMADIPPGAAPPPPHAPAAPPGAPAPRMPLRRLGWRRFLVLAGVVLLIAAGALFMVFTLGESLGAEALLIGVIAAILPVPVLVFCFLWLDRYEPEPLKYLIFCFAWGAFVSTAISLLVNTASAGLFEDRGLPVALTAVLVAPFIEELTKAAGPLLVLIFRRREFSGITDGLVYCGLSAVGFAMVENILYLGGHGYRAGADEYGPATGAQQVIAIFIVRILLFGFAHPLFTSMTGVGLGVAARTADRRVRVLAPLAGLLLAMILHGTWNLLPSLAQATGETVIVLYGYIGVMVPIFFAMVGLAVWLRAWEGRLTERTLPDYVRAGWLTPPEVAALGSLGRRHAARTWARRVAGDGGVRAMRGYQFAATRLALLRDGMRRGLDRKPEERERTAREERELLDAITAYRSFFVGRDPQAPVGVWDGQRYHLRFPDGSQRPVEAPDDPVVPIPVVLAQPPAFPQGGYGPSGWHGGPGAGHGPASGHGYGPGAGHGPGGWHDPGAPWHPGR
ncbi:PrsW family intramembrane metalloprotease [Micromonospora tulbaghiae]|uniref:Membrane proteinase PrsW, cleaves anti-sigma factor RsiW, M82 family n=1 Tax=Micromonospora tulbaghiae TaxID=479978 RepID=A0AAW4JQ83_9ACTN|nr:MULTISPECIES: PrsW family intramembrane metalloprotease [Micromonospora]MBO4143927.1 PrsW family intramembrane metalloprotease [Micromonospora tulbaghiae]MDX5458421.1 PrsW family glutamic-type intramembrane protease [Micromonospora tulbaghiae]SCF03582.1 Membrane proteinase PrsW, cleaves anti-sigma factor RsiW, M82 family [Micromonospora tulbaghiae]